MRISKGVVVAVGKAALKAAGLAGGSDKVAALEAKLEVATLKLAIARQALEPFGAVQADDQVSIDMLDDARQAFELIKEG